MLQSSFSSWYRPFRWAVAMTALLVVVSGCLGQETEPSLEERAQEIDRGMMCPVCPSETVDQSQVELAKQMRVIIREKLVAGESRQEILDFFVARYGESVLAAPSKSGFNLVAWVMPGVGLVVGIAVLLLALRAMRRQREMEEVQVLRPPLIADDELEPYLSRVSEEMEQLLKDAAPPPAGRSTASQS